MKARALRFCVLCIFVGIAPGHPSALPKEGTGTCTCLCAVPYAGGEIFGYNTYDSRGLSCSAFAGATCGVEDPNTGGIINGKIYTCDANPNTKGKLIILSPFGEVSTVLRSQLRPSIRRH
jgi:hypothetical protein